MSKRGFYSNSNETPTCQKRRKIEGDYMKNGTRSASTNEYSVGWICAISTELTAATAFLDEKFDAREYNLPDDDNNDYTLGRIGGHYVALTVLPAYGTDTAAAVAKDMMRSFPSIRIRLMVGIGGGAPTSKHDIRLGDIVVSVPQNGKSGVLQYDFGKTMQNQEFQMTRVLNQPPQNLLAAVNGLRTDYESQGHLLEEEIESAFQRLPRLRETYQRPNQSSDRLYKSDVIHPRHDDRSCSIVCGDAASIVVPRTKRPSDKNITIHHGLVASANQVMKDATTRDKLALQNEVLCFEMEAAGLMNDFSCLVIRGICDYSDSHKNKDWQGYAAMAAAAYAKDLLNRLRPIRAESSHIISSQLESDQGAGEHQSFPADKLEMILKSLSFEQIGARHLTIKNAHAKTCKWLIKHQAYLDWQDPSKLESHHGFLWIKGKAGAGKSTLMKFALTDAQKKMKDKKIISFYFNARGGDLEKCTTGMYRSLLLQLLEQLPELQSILYSSPLVAVRENYSWNIQQLKSLFEEAIHNIRDDAVVCFIDALDECNEDEIRDMVSFFQNVGEFTTSNGIKFLVCFSSRHYPHISKKNAMHLILEGQEGHNQDISNYIHSELNIGKSKLAENIRATVQKKSAGIFMWIILVVEILNKEYDGGHIHRLRQRLDDIPEDLHQLFRDILTRDSYRRNELLLCIQWLLFSRQPLKPEELYFAVLSGPGPESVISWNVDEISMEDIKKFILSCSKGLAEITKSKSPTVQFIHESVKDFLLKEKGLKEICDDFADDFERQSHDRLKQCCLQCLNGNLESGKIPESLPKASSSNAKILRQLLRDKFPFLDYAVQNVLYHANAAEMGHNEQAIFFQTFDFDTWITLNNVFERFERRWLDRRVTQLYVLAIHNAGNLIRHHPSKLSCFETEKSRYGLPILAALVANSYDAVGAFLEVHAHAALSEDRPKASILQHLYKEYLQDANKRKWGSKDFQFSRQNNILSYLAGYGDAIVTSFWLNWADVDVNLPDKQGDTALIVAVGKGNDDVVNLLLNWAGIDVDQPDKQGDTALIVAAGKGNDTVVNLLLEHQADIKAKNARYELPQHKAALWGHGSTIKILLEAGADILAKDGKNRSPLYYAVARGHAAVVEVLLKAGADIEEKNRDNKSLLHCAVAVGHAAVVEVLLKAGADIKEKNADDESPLHCAVARGRAAVVKILLEAGADIKEKNTDNKSPLHCAVARGYAAVVEVLLKAGANIKEKNTDNKSLLHCAVAGGYTAVVKILLEAGADFEEKNADAESPLFIAVRKSHGSIVEMLLKAGANAEGKNKDTKSPLYLAVETGFRDIVKLLLKARVNVKGREGKSALYLAVEKGYKDIVELLWRTSANTHLVGNNSESPLHIAAKRGDGDMVKFLLHAGAYVEQKVQGALPLHIAMAAQVHGRCVWTESRRSAVAELLRKGTASVNEQDDHGRTPLHYAADNADGGYFWWEDAITLLIRNGAGVNAQTPGGETPLHFAAARGPVTAAKLLEAGAGIDTKNNHGETPLHRACSTESYSSVKLLLENGADIEATDQEGETPLHKAARGDPRSIELLISNNANLQSKNNNGLTALEIAQIQFTEAVDYGREYVAQSIIDLLEAAHNQPKR